LLKRKRYYNRRMRKFLIYSAALIFLGIFLFQNSFKKSDKYVKRELTKKEIIESKEEVKSDLESKKTNKIKEETHQYERINTPKNEKKYPEWFEKVLSIYEKYKKEDLNKKEESKSVQLKDEANVIAYQTPSTNPSQSQVISPLQAPISVPNYPSQTIISSPKVINIEKKDGEAAGGFYSMSGSSGSNPPSNIDQDNQKPEENNQNNNDENNQENTDIEAIRKIYQRNNLVDVSIEIKINSNDISGLIVSERIPQNYTISLSSPQFSKKTNNEYKWLFYGKSLGSQTINYQLQGSGEGVISGDFKSSKGSGYIKGDSKIKKER